MFMYCILVYMCHVLWRLYIVVQAVWTLLSEMSQYIASLLDVKFVLDNWKLHSSTVSMETTAPLVQILTVIGNSTRFLGKISLEDISGVCVCACVCMYMYVCMYVHVCCACV